MCSFQLGLELNNIKTQLQKGGFSTSVYGTPSGGFQ